MRIGLIGAGQFGRRHLETIRNEPQCELAGVADPAWQGEKGYAEYREMLDRAKPDGVIIATPNALHVPAGLACIERRVPILVEKPIAETVLLANQLVEVAERERVPLLVGHHRRHNPLLEKAREIVQGGGIGRLTAVAALWLLQKPADYFDVAWRRERGGGPLLINAIHDIDDLRFVCGEIDDVRALVSNSARNFPVEDTAAIAIRFANGALGTLTVSDAVPAPWSWELASGENPVYPRQEASCYFFTGTQGALSVPDMTLFSYGEKKGWYAPLSKKTIEVTREDPQVRQLRHFCRVIRGEEAPRIDGADATRTLAVVEAIRKAAHF